jgi:hypothetical protein
MKKIRRARVVVAVGLTVLGGSLALAWTPLPVKQDQNLFMPGTQQGDATLERAESNCLNCHAGYDPIAEPGENWQGSMMAQAARDPLWKTCLTVADQDSIWALGNPNAGDLCIRCHSPVGWLGGRSDPTNTSGLDSQSGDFEGINCDACHRMLDPFNALHQPGLPAETNADAIAQDNLTTNEDNTVLQTLLLFNSNAFYNATTRLPVYYGAGDITNYSESTSGQYFIDTIQNNYKRGPYYDADPKKHQPYYSRFHKSRGMCATCHDVSNPALANVAITNGLPERAAAGSYFHVERTLSEFKLSAYGRGAGTNVNPRITAAFSNVTWAATCQDCHMHNVTGKACNKQVQIRTNSVPLHDLTGGNAWISGILASADQGGPVYNVTNYNILSGTKYPNAYIDVAGLQGLGPQLTNGQQRALAELHMAATLEIVTNASSETILRIVNNTGHKLISGFPEGRRMWLNVKCYDSTNGLIDEINPYTPLVVTNIAGNYQYVSGGILTKTRDDLVYETAMMSSLTSEDHTFHFVLATDRYKDNRIPPKGFDVTSAASRKAQPRWDGADATNYFTAAEYAGGYDEVTFTKPAGTSNWVANLYYQTTSKDYVEFLRNEILGTNTTLSSPTPSGEANAYIVQTDSFFSTLKDWGNAIYDLWLANGGAAPVLMTSTNALNPAAPAPVVTSITPTCGPVAGGTPISITGSNFQSGATVNLGGSVIVNGDTNITAVTNPDTAGVKDVTVTNPDAQSGTLSNAFTYAAPPVFAGLQSVTSAVEAATLTWSAASSAYPVTYSVFESLTNGGQNFNSPVFTTNALSAYITPLDPGTNTWLTYYFVVRASDPCGGSELNTVELSVQPALDPTKDQDGDGMPNGYEQTYGLNPFDAADAGLDPDGDGFTSLQESIAGTSPVSSEDLPKIESVTAEEDGMHIRFLTVSGRQYQVQWRESLTEGDWANLGSPVSGDNTEQEVLDTPSADTTTRFYRLVITMP